MTSKSGKTLSLKKKPADKPAARSDDAPRKRSGARARNVAIRGLTQEKQAGAAQEARRTDGHRVGSGRRVQRDDHAATGMPARAQRSRPEREPRTDMTRDFRPSARGARSDVQGDLPAAPRTDRPRIERLARRPKRVSQRPSTFSVFAPCPQGLEEALEMELQALGFTDAQAGRSGCGFETDWTGVMRANLYSRLATRVLVQLAHAPVQTEDDILELARDTAWEAWFGPEQTLRVDTSAIRSPMKSLQYCNLRAKDGICDRLREREGARPDIDTVRPDAKVHLFLDETSATLYLDTSGESLFKRGWRLDKGAAPLRENLAAGLLALSDWDPSQALMDPFCGSGTILIEAAWIALGVPPGIWRPFGFERLRHHDSRHWRDLKTEARSHIATQLDVPLVGIDVDPHAISAAKANLERAHLTPDTIRFEVGDARQALPPAPTGWLVTNPPYGERLPEESDSLWAEWAQNLKRHYSGWQVSIISSDMDLPRQLRLKPQRRIPVYNGALECRLFNFEMVASGYR